MDELPLWALLLMGYGFIMLVHSIVIFGIFIYQIWATRGQKCD